MKIVLGDRRLTDRETQFLQLPVNPWRTPQGILQVDSSRMRARTSAATPGRPGALSASSTSRRDESRVRCHAMTVLRLDEEKRRPPTLHVLRQPRPEDPTVSRLDEVARGASDSAAPN